MKSIPVLVLLGSIALAVTLPVSAQDMKGGGGKGHSLPVFSDCDLNGNGVIVAAEFYEARGKRMAERAAAGGQMRNAANAPSFESIDTNGDEEISEEEFNAHKAKVMEMRQQRMQSRS